MSDEQQALTVSEIRQRAQAWLARQKADANDDLLDTGDCRYCGSPNGEGHEDTDPCGIVNGLLDQLASVSAALSKCQKEHQLLRASVPSDGAERLDPRGNRTDEAPSNAD